MSVSKEQSLLALMLMSMQMFIQLLLNIKILLLISAIKDLKLEHLLIKIQLTLLESHKVNTTTTVVQLFSLEFHSKFAQ